MKQCGVLFVCTGNICRSPTAEAVFRHHVKAAGWQDRFIVDSAGTHDHHAGDPPDGRTVAAARARGISMDDLRARQVKRSDFDDFDYILAMDKGHYDFLKKMTPSDSESKLALFMSYTGRDIDVPDPYYAGKEYFELVLDLVEQGVESFLVHVKEKQGW